MLTDDDAVYGDTPPLPDAVKARPPSMDQCARETYNLAPSWEAYSWEAKGKDKMTGWLELKGGVYRHKRERGKSKGETDFSKPEPGTTATVAIPYPQFAAWKSRWEADTGYCAACNGTGREWWGWTAGKGTKHRACRNCGETGRSAQGPMTRGVETGSDIKP